MEGVDPPWKRIETLSALLIVVHRLVISLQLSWMVTYRQLVQALPSLRCGCGSHQCWLLVLWACGSSGFSRLDNATPGFKYSKSEWRVGHHFLSLPHVAAPPPHTQTRWCPQ